MSILSLRVCKLQPSNHLIRGCKRGSSTRVSLQLLPDLRLSDLMLTPLAWRQSVPRGHAGKLISSRHFLLLSTPTPTLTPPSRSLLRKPPKIPTVFLSQPQSHQRALGQWPQLCTSTRRIQGEMQSRYQLGGCALWKLRRKGSPGRSRTTSPLLGL